MKVSYNSPVILTFALISAGVLALDEFAGAQLAQRYFSAPTQFQAVSLVDYFRMVAHIFGHQGWEHLVGNFIFILLIGPILEEKYGSILLLLMIVVTAVVTALLNATFFSTSLMGASGIVFMLIVLSSFTNVKETGKIPLTFILIILIFLVKEFAGALAEDRISQFAHIIGGVCGAGFGFLFVKKG